MSTRNENGIEFSILPEESLQHFRLLELPAEILELLTSDNPPTLQLKSTEGPTGSNKVFLCTPNKTFDLRQVSTSNSVFITQSTFASDDPESLPQAQLQAIAQPQSTLEVIKSTRLSAALYIAAKVPVYTSTGHYSQKDKITRPDLFANIPLSDAECDSGWIQLACFELGDDRHCVRPSASTTIKAWETMLRTATAAGIDLTVPQEPSVIKQISITDEDMPNVLLAAVFRSMCSGLSLDLDRDGCAEVVGKTLLKHLTDTAKGPVPFATFFSRWEDLMPEPWRELAKLSSIPAHHKVETDGRHISVVEEESLNDAAAANGLNKSEAKSSLGAKRKWHEKLRANKKAA